MSGILALVETGAVAAAARQAATLTARLSSRGPDRQTTWCEGAASLGHTLLRTLGDAGDDPQPLTLDGRTWIVSDARIDDRAALASSLDVNLAAAPVADAELILRAHAKWGERCVEHLLGDFAFAIWDRTAERLFCARDHMGVKPLYYAASARRIVLGSSIDCLRAHPDVSSSLDETAIADFLLFGCHQDLSSTSFRAITRVPPAHTLTWSRGEIAVRRYWELPLEEPLLCRRDAEYLEQFDTLLRQSVRDRLRTGRVAILMSGGVDSTLLAARSAQLLAADASSTPVRAYTFVYDTLIPDSERRFAQMAADHLRIPIHYTVADAPQWTVPPAAGTPEPVAGLGREAELRCYAEMSTHSRVAFYGEGPDNALVYEWPSYVAHLWRRRRMGRLASDVGRFLWYHRRVPLLGAVRARLAPSRSAALEPRWPEWIDEDLAVRLQLRDRWRQAQAALRSAHPTKPRAYASLSGPLWQSLFDSLDPAVTGVPLDVRHPFLDVRLLRFLLRVPAVPWARQKHLLRAALRGDVPEAVRLRPKTPLGGSPDYARVRRSGSPPAHASRSLERFGSLERLPDPRTSSVPDVEAGLRLISLSHWLRATEERGHREQSHRRTRPQKNTEEHRRAQGQRSSEPARGAR